MDTFASVPQGEEMGRNALLTSKRKPEQIKNLFALLKKRPTTVKTAAAAGQPTEPSMWFLSLSLNSSISRNVGPCFVALPW